MLPALPLALHQAFEWFKGNCVDAPRDQQYDGRMKFIALNITTTTATAHAGREVGT